MPCAARLSPTTRTVARGGMVTLSLGASGGGAPQAVLRDQIATAAARPRDDKACNPFPHPCVEPTIVIVPIVLSPAPTPMAPSDPAAHLPLRPVELLLLTMLSAGNRHGYGLRQDILDHTGGRIALEAGSLYRHIRRLEDDGLIGEAETPPDDDERRICYGLTALGRKVLAAEMHRLRALVRLAEARRIISPAKP